MLLTKWTDVEEWCTRNGFKRIVVRTSDRSQAGENDRSNDCVYDSRNASGDWNDKLDFFRWMLEHSDRKVYATGFQNENAGTGGMVAEIRFENAAPAPTSAPVGYAPIQPGQQIDEEAIIARVRKEMEVQYAKQEFDRERKMFEAEKKEFNATKSGIIGAVVEYAKPILEAMAARNRVVAGIDQPGEVVADPISPEAAPVSEGEQVEESVFSEEEAEQLMDLMERFKAVEPDYLRLIRSVVEMAEAGDATYTMARGFLIK